MYSSLCTRVQQWWVISQSQDSMWCSSWLQASTGPIRSRVTRKKNSHLSSSGSALARGVRSSVMQKWVQYSMGCYHLVILYSTTLMCQSALYELELVSHHCMQWYSSSHDMVTSLRKSLSSMVWRTKETHFIKVKYKNFIQCLILISDNISLKIHNRIQRLDMSLIGLPQRI